MALQRPNMPPNLGIRSRLAHSGPVGRRARSAAPGSPDRTPRASSRPGGWLLPRAHPEPRPRRRPARTAWGPLPRSDPAGRDGDPPSTRRRILFSRPDAARSSSARCPRRWFFARLVPAMLALPFPCQPARMAGGAGHGRGTMCGARISSAGIADEGEPARPVAAHRSSCTASRTHVLSARMREHA